MKSIVIHVSGGKIQGIYQAENSPHGRVVIMDDEELGVENTPEKQLAALKQLEGHEPDGFIDFSEIHSELSNYISSDDVYPPLED